MIAVCPAIIYATEAAGDYACTFVSENIEQILGYTQREMRDDPDFWTTHIHPQDSRRVLAEVFRLIPEGGGNLEYRFRHHDGHYRWFQDSFKTVFDAAGQPLEIVGSWADITQRKLAESFQTLYQASFSIREPLGLKKWFDGFLRTARDVLHVDRLTILLADPEGAVAAGGCQHRAGDDAGGDPSPDRPGWRRAGCRPTGPRSQLSATADSRCGTSIA